MSFSVIDRMQSIKHNRISFENLLFNDVTKGDCFSRYLYLCYSTEMKEQISRKRICDSPIHFLKFLICQDELHDKDYVNDLYTKTFFYPVLTVASNFTLALCPAHFSSVFLMHSTRKKVGVLISKEKA